MATRSTRSTVKQAPTKSNDPNDWMDQAACAGWDFEKNGDPFYPTSSAPAAAQQAQAVCKGCRVQDTCAFYARAEADTFRYGIFAGSTPEDRSRAARKRAREEIRKPRK